MGQQKRDALAFAPWKLRGVGHEEEVKGDAKGEEGKWLQKAFFSPLGLLYGQSRKGMP